MLMSDGFGRLKRWDLNHFNDDSHAEEVHFIFSFLVAWSPELSEHVCPMLSSVTSADHCFHGEMVYVELLR